MGSLIQGKCLNEEFNRILMRSINFTIRELGESAEVVIRYYLEKNYI